MGLVATNTRLIRAYRHGSHTEPMMLQRPQNVKKWPHVLVASLLLASLLPYGLPVEERPSIYRDGLTPEQMQERRKSQEMKRFLGGDVNELSALWGE